MNSLVLFELDVLKTAQFKFNQQVTHIHLFWTIKTNE